ncbi:tyrosine-type recombinase/integrase [Hanstruepera ponticola]|uniref:tyrosine-type recombinase/integrase n=1 Tax=Hanstruepera ponticola TaxID=2042995 RepID=UPI00177CCE97|nr:site-specific integrase [Hanstruepera ponticola]
MFTLTEFLTFEHEKEPQPEHKLAHKKQFSAPKIYTGDNDLKRRWYVYFSFRNPSTGKMERQKNIYGIANKMKTKTDRYTILNFYKKTLHRLLREGYNPYENNLERFLGGQTISPPKEPKVEVVPAITYPKTTIKPLPFLKKEKEAETISQPVQQVSITEPKTEKVEEEERMSLREAFDFALKMKEKLVKPRTIQDYRNRSKNFIKWLKEEHPNVKHPDQITRKMCMGYLNQHLIKNTPRTRNNSRVDLSSMMQVLEDNEIIPVNVMRKTPVVKSKPERHKRYDSQTLDAIFSYLEEQDPILLLYIKFISFNFMRPIEVNRLRVKDLNLKTKTLTFQAKNSPLKTKIIPDLVLEALPDLSKLPGDNPLITNKGIGLPWNTTVDNRRDYFSKRFKRVVKDKFNLGADFGLYSFRHTFITKLYRKLLENSSPFEAKSVLMTITGHTSMQALEKYLRDIDAFLPSDYSDLIRMDGE